MGINTDQCIWQEMSAEKSIIVPQNKVGFARSKRQIRVQSARVIQVEWGQRSNSIRWFGDSGSMRHVLGKVTN